MRKILISASAALFFFAACNSQGTTNPNETQYAANALEAAAPVSSDIAYINIDSLLSKYDMFLDMSAALEEKATKADAELTAKGRSLERNAKDFQEKAEKGLATRAQLAEMQEKLARQEQGFYEHRDKMQMELAEENQVMQNNIFHKIQTFLQEFNSDYRYGVILTTSGGTPIMHADPRLDITGVVLEGLNEQYAKEKK